MKKMLLAAVLSLFLCGTLNAQTIYANKFMTWGIGADQIIIPLGSIVTEAVLTVYGVSSSQTSFKIHLLDDTVKGFYQGTDTSGLNCFEGYGVPLKGSFISGNYVCKLSQNNDLSSSVWSIFPLPCKITLADTTTTQLTSSILSLIDYAGNSRGFGIGIDPGNANYTFRYMTLVLTLKKYQGTYSSSKITFKLTFNKCKRPVGCWKSSV